jgi:hypothetical protein
MLNCRDFGALPEAGGYLDQPADLMIHWREYADVEREVRKERGELDRAMAEMRAGRSHG